MNQQIKNYGFLPPKEITPDQYVLGGGKVPKVVLRSDGDWTDIEDKEIQRKAFDTFNCTGFNTLSGIEKMIFVITGEKVNYSDRFLGIMAGTYPPGNDPHTVCEAVRKFGCIPEEMMPYSDDLQNVGEYFSWKGVDKEACIAEGKKWLAKYEFLHEWIFNGRDSDEVKKTKLLESLNYCPPSVGVVAWIREGDKYVSQGRTPTHWTGLAKGVPKDKWVSDDSYTDGVSTLKDLIWDFEFYYPKRYYIRLKTENEIITKTVWEILREKGLSTFFIDWFKRFFKL